MAISENEGGEEVGLVMMKGKKEKTGSDENEKARKHGVVCPLLCFCLYVSLVCFCGSDFVEFAPLGWWGIHLEL